MLTNAMHVEGRHCVRRVCPPCHCHAVVLLRRTAICRAATATVAVSSGEQASYDQEQRIWFGNDGPPTQMRVLFGMISWCNQTAGFTPQVRYHCRRKRLVCCPCVAESVSCALRASVAGQGRGNGLHLLCSS